MEMRDSIFFTQKMTNSSTIFVHEILRCETFGGEILKKFGKKKNQNFEAVFLSHLLKR